MPTLNNHTHCQAAQANRTNQSLSKSVFEPTHGQKRKKHESTTMGIKHRADSGFRKFRVLSKVRFGRIVESFEMPYVSYPRPLASI